MVEKKLQSKIELFEITCEENFPFLKLLISFKKILQKKYLCSIRVKSKSHYIDKFRLSELFYDNIQQIFKLTFVVSDSITWDTCLTYGRVEFNFTPLSFYERCCLGDFKDENDFKKSLFKHFNIIKKETDLYQQLYQFISDTNFFNSHVASSCKRFYNEFKNIVNLIKLTQEGS